VRLPNQTQRTAVLGRTGSGKSIFSLWLLSKQQFNIPWYIIDYKIEKEIARIPKRQLIEKSVTDNLSKKPGLFIVRPLPTDESAVEDFMWRVWEQGRTGIFIDEAHMLPDKAAFQALLTQGRSKRIPMIVVSQRPVWVSRFVFSEADFYAVFHLNDRRDHATVESFVPVDLDRPLPQFHCYWHDVAKNETVILSPVPEPTILRERIADKVPRPLWA
jgi:DNA helicase HerA-like ATPase